MAKKKNKKDNYNNDIGFVLSGDTLTVSVNTNENTVTNVELLNKPSTTKVKKDNKKYIAVVRLVKGNQLHTSQIFNDKDSLKRWMKKLNIIKSKVIEIDI